MTDILEILEQQGIEYHKSNNPAEIYLHCTSPDHDDNNPSLGFNIEKNIFKCWGCGFSGGIGKFLESIGVSTRIPITSKQEFKINLLKRRLHAIIQADSIEMPKSFTKAAGRFRNISSEIIKEFEGFFTTEYDFEDYLCFPIYQFGKLKFIEGRNRFPNSDKSKYRRQPTSSKTTDILFPLDKLARTDKIILVEGLFDMLNLWQLGYKNTLCIFGATNFGVAKAEVLDRLGISKVIIMMDGDSAGYTAANKIQQILTNKYILSHIVKLPHNTDPGNLTQEEAQFYLEKIEFKEKLHSV